MVRKLLLRVDPACQTQKVEFAPRNEEQRRALSATGWRSRAPETIRHIQLIAERLASSPHEFVFFHFDGDVVWSKRAQSQHAAHFEQVFRKQVKDFLEFKRLPADSATLSRLIAVTPYWEMEAWLYQATDHAAALCQSGCGNHTALFAQWKSNRQLLDEVTDPKDLTCVGSKHNEHLAQHFPAGDVEAAGKSFAATVAVLRGIPALTAALAHTHA